MAASNLLVLIDDIATLLDDIAVQSKVAAKKTVGVLSDDLALNAQQVSGVSAERELPVIWAVAKGSLVNKAILVPVAMLISLFIPWAITPLLMLGGAYLCFEGSEKVIHSFFHHPTSADDDVPPSAGTASDKIDFEKTKIRGAIRTDFILSAEIIVICLGTLTQQSIAMQAAVLAVLAVILTIGVYGIVAALVKIDDLGLRLIRHPQASPLRLRLGHGLLDAAPKIMKLLSIAGTAAMFLVGGGILLHGITPLHHLVVHWAEAVHHAPTALAWLSALVPTLANAVSGLTAGILLVGISSLISKIRAYD